MQERQFDNLMDGRAAKFAQMFEDQTRNIGLMGALMRAKEKGATPEEIQTARAEIEKREVEIPPDTRKAIDLIIALERSKGKSERAVRRIIQKKFNITVV